MVKNILLAGALLMGGNIANASTVNITETIDALQWATGTPSYSQNYVIEQGDTVNLDITFANSESIKLTSTSNIGYTYLATRNSSGSSFTMSGLSAVLSDFVTNGSGSNSPSTGILSSGFVHLGPAYSKSELGLNIGQFIQFSGFQVSFLVSALTTSPSNSSATFTGTPGQYWTREVISSVSAVPVPAALWLFGTALIGLIGFGKRKAGVAV